MSTLDRIVLNLVFNHAKENGQMPKYADCVIRWKDNGKLEKVIIALFNYDENTVSDSDDEQIFFYVSDAAHLHKLLSPLDIENMPTEDLEEFEKELNKYDDTDEDKEYYFSSGEDFDVVSVTNLFDEL